jgi:hypothetical protein
MEKKFTTETFDKFSNAKTISTIRQKKFGGWTETHEPNQSLQLYKSDGAMPSLNINFEVRLYASIVSSTNPNGEEIYFEMLNYYKDSHADKGSMNQDFSKTKLDFVIDNENMSLNAEMINNGENRFARSGLVNKDIFTRKQLLKFPISKEQFKKFCDGKSVFIRITGIQNPVRIKNDHELDSATIKSLQTIAKQFYNEAIQENAYLDVQNMTPPSSNSGKSGGCFIATAAMGNYEHPVVLDLRMFRDNWLLKRNWGVQFTNWYYTHGPKAASIIEKSLLLRKLTFILIVKPLQIITKKLK